MQGGTSGIPEDGVISFLQADAAWRGLFPPRKMAAAVVEDDPALGS